MASEVSIFAGRSTKYLAQKIAEASGIKLGEVGPLPWASRFQLIILLAAF